MRVDQKVFLHGVTIRETTKKDTTFNTKWEKLLMVILGAGTLINPLYANF